jgi:glycosyltransferase involved in cell wall biosynthesis
LARRILSRHINKYTDPVVFGCNSLFYYQLIPSLNENIKCIDLIHAFVNYNEPGSEYWSLPVADRIDKRVVINKKTIEDYKELYSKNNKGSDLLNRIEYIPNFIDVTESGVKPGNEKLNIIYVGRSSPEKRVYLIGRIAQKASEKKANAEFILVGDMQNALLKSDEQYCKLTGEVSNSLQMQKIYEQADILLLTSSREGFPLVIMEAMANQVVVITTNVGGIAEHIKNNETGILINTNSEDNLVDDFVNNIIDLSHDRDKLSRLSKNAYAYAKANFSRSQFINAYRKIVLTKEG